MNYLQLRILVAVAILTPFSCSDSQNAMSEIVDVTCSRIVACNPGVITQDECRTEMLNANLDDEYGLPETFTFSVQDMIDGVDDGTFSLNESAAAACIALTEALPCDEIAGGFDPDDPQDFGNVENFIPEETAVIDCGDVLS